MAGSVGGVSHPLRTASASRASASIGLLASLGGPISATTRSWSVTRTVSPEAASRTYSLNRLFNTFIPTDLIHREVATRSNLVKPHPLDGRLRVLSALAIVSSIPFGRVGPAVAQFNEPLVSVITLGTISCPGSYPGWVLVYPVPARAWEAGEVVASYLALQASLRLSGFSR